MTRSDLILLAKKIAVGILVTLLPALILFWGLHLTQTLLKSSPPNTQVNHP
ncbi:hypothetical protein LX87_02514 [Larkinella arboricola]|uniref:Uncharacterized protein n=1 Tax=Larkinella arboricola TaxID=643671 RepID=A0A327WWC6_LARAB|nr:hypothetical protein [Larkinella arboricola]RAJ97611.1 hypothetical protein LX87_02514 [Larkinella arboricola]